MISRGFVGYFVQKIAKTRKIKTIRELHADILGEIRQIDKQWIIKKILIPLAHYSQIIDMNSDMRIFNHPDLLQWYKNKFRDSKNDLFSYNGFGYEGKSMLSQAEARKKSLILKKI